MKKLFLVLLLSVFTLSLVNVKADEYSKLYRENSIETKEIATGVNYSLAIGDTQTTKPSGNVAGYGSSGSIELNTWYGQQINMLDINPTDSLKVVPWSIQQNNQWLMTNIINIAKDFEKNNPGWIVLGGVNADFYDWHTRKDYPQSGNGVEIRYNEVIRCGKWSGAVAITNEENSVNQLIYANNAETTFTSTPVLTIYNENNEVVSEITLDKVNQELSDGETGVYFGRYILTYAYDSEGNQILDGYNEHKILSRIYQVPQIFDGSKYLVQNASKVIQQVNDGSFYGKGSITEIDGASSIEKDDFCIITKDQEVQNLLSLGTTIRVQYELTGKLEGSENVMSVYQPLIINGEWADFYSTDSYFTTRAPRTLIASKADGSIGLITMDGRQSGKNYYGTNQEEINAILENYGYTSAYLLDGGGSSSFIIRNGSTFDIVNSPSDGAIRSVANGLFVVMRDPKIEHSVTDIKQNSLTINASVVETYGEDINKLYVKINDDELKEVVDGKVYLSGLTSSTEYKYQFITEDTEGNQTLVFTQGKASTLKKVPIFYRLDISESETEYIIKVIVDDPDSAFSSPLIIINNQTVIAINNEARLLKTRVGDSIYYTSITTQYNINTGSSVAVVYENADFLSTMFVSMNITTIKNKVNDIFK